jgi:hypothetical protein
MGYWNHRVVKRMINNEVSYGIHEVFYNDDNSIYAYTDEPIQVQCESLEDLREYLQWMLNCIDKEVLVDSEVEFVDKQL